VVNLSVRALTVTLPQRHSSVHSRVSHTRRSAVHTAVSLRQGHSRGPMCVGRQCLWVEISG
jgi:hypothetical protein